MYSLSVLGEQRRIGAYLDGLPPVGDLRQAKVNALLVPVLSGRELQSPKGMLSASGEELSALYFLNQRVIGFCGFGIAKYLRWRTPDLDVYNGSGTELKAWPGIIDKPTPSPSEPPIVINPQQEGEANGNKRNCENQKTC